MNRVASIKSSIEATRARLRLAELRVGQTKQLAAAPAITSSRSGGRPTWSRSAPTSARCCRSSRRAEQEVTAYRAKAAGLREKVSARSGDEQADVAQIVAQLREDARWKLQETTCLCASGRM